ncbi:hypothetical protein HA402_005246 [Bradysia odoriphaga]|nr:hypothetical protein HA402_005246 [Bradysia odoriphaga]
MFIIIVVMLVIVCALAFAYRRSKSNVQRNATTISLTTSEQEPPAYKPDDLPGYSVPIFTIANADSLHGRYVNAEDKESPPTYEEAIVIGPNVNVVPRRE